MHIYVACYPVSSDGILMTVVVQVVAIRINSFNEAESKISEFQSQMLAVHFMASRVVIPFVDCSAELQEQAHEKTLDFMQCTWPVQSTMEGVLKVCVSVHVASPLVDVHACA